MSGGGRGRGYSGRYHLREELRPGDDKAEPAISDMDPASKKLPDAKPADTKQMSVKYDGANEEGLLKEAPETQEDDLALQELLHVDEQYKPLLTLLEQFSPGEDGIQFNRKLRHFETTVTNMCPDEPRLVQAFGTLRAAALRSAGEARRLAAVGASFTRQQRQQLLRGALLNVVMQGTFAKLDVLERASPQYLINAANLMGDYFAEARLCNGNKVHILAAPLLQYMKSLLVCNDIRAHRSLATQLMQNGRELLTVLSQELDDLSISIRMKLLTQPPVSIIWLLLSADLCLNKFLPLPNTLQQFYASHLDLTQDEQTPSYCEVNYGSWKKSPERDDPKNASLHDSSNEMNVSTEKANQSLQLNLSHDDSLDASKPKLRPILGAGAGLLRQEALTQNHVLTANQDNFEAWSNSNVGKSSLAKRYDLNSWRQNGEEPNDLEEPVFNPSVLPPNLTNSYPSNITIPDYPPPPVTVNQRLASVPPVPIVPIVPTVPTPQPESLAPANYLQQGDGKYIQSQYNDRFVNANSFSQGDGAFITSQPYQNAEQSNSAPANVGVIPNEVQKTPNADRSKRPVENWRKDKAAGDPKDDPNKNRPKTWTRQKSTSSQDGDGEEKNGEGRRVRSSSKGSREGRSSNRQSRNKEETPEVQKPLRRHVMDVPRGERYWDHDDRCDKDYNS